MINLGIIAEYNPFHNGHKYHYDELYKQLKPDLTMCVMSGNFVQRGEPAIFDKWTRAKLALSSGIDVVLELPVTFALGSAERFAFGAVSILNDLGATHLAFGVEDSVEELSELLDRYLRFEFNIKEHIKNNDNSYIKARNEILENSELLRKPNNILAFEYLKALRKLRSNIIPIGIKRKAVDHDSDKTVGEFASASAIRKLIVEGNSYDQFVPYKTEPKPFLVKNDFSKLINFKIMTMGPERIGKIQGVREGLEFKFYKNGFLDLSAEELIMAVKSKRYTYTAISRMLFCILLGIEKTSYDDKPEYTRLLGISVNYSRKFKSIAKNFKIPVITNAAAVYRTNDEAVLQAEQDYLASDIYFSLLKREEKGRVDFTTLPHIHWS